MAVSAKGIANTIEKWTARAAKEGAKSLDDIADAVLKNREKITQGIGKVMKEAPVEKGFEDILAMKGASGKIGFKQAMGGMGRNISYAASAEGGGIWRNFGKQAATGALVNAGVSGTVEWGQGGSFWEGAKSGLVTGAIYGGMYGAIKAGVGMPGASGTLRQTGSRVSKQVQAMMINEESVAAANEILKRGNKFTMK